MPIPERPAPHPREPLPELAKKLVATLPHVVSGRVELLALELRRTSDSVLELALLMLASALFLATAWFALWLLLAWWLSERGVPWGVVAGGAGAVNLALTALAVLRGRRRLPKLTLPATLRSLTVHEHSVPVVPAAGTDELDRLIAAAEAEVAQRDRQLLRDVDAVTGRVVRVAERGAGVAAVAGLALMVASAVGGVRRRIRRRAGANGGPAGAAAADGRTAAPAIPHAVVTSASVHRPVPLAAVYAELIPWHRILRRVWPELPGRLREFVGPDAAATGLSIGLPLLIRLLFTRRR